MVLREARKNNLSVAPSTANSPSAVVDNTWLTKRPVRIAAVYPIKNQFSKAQFTITGGLGYVPATITDVKDCRAAKLQYPEGKTGPWSEVNQAREGNDFWQAGYDPYNVKLDSMGDVTKTWEFLFTAGAIPAL